ncbi:four-carbon acid sugar kinase family protein [Mesorhizobium sp. M7A.F.Ca.US.006.04.2.1]|uniref:four-carbon acid sugar kinase family protein n=1 Tax=unclassified Mesorhizobium TaxID=325217 RepID=UPI000FCCB92A|nr:MULTISPECIES: four-carbon acid sugar kinase family protein [unclassified Mesorhizobium]RUX76692.1 four-carbon acid sugar kinase family protein [Mesorhizobium sp. M7A.F.Ca.US.005.03.1.1]RUY18685.1 four-carbon acid sugar kinase family protein [Mesorhizobium sp. M7A.F.Ca.US.005.03.2.1]RUY24465.1 four-carbon acid sugar kinase family protein [Mesorhizobium sp. M7A.F.Ca.US.001.04.2.1]RUY40509.1 four-carbon acid sugar kinase family protein [Mesorhizobium sp. M7A.F.Ca.US.001.04.1.1]RVA96348.1 four-
MRTNHQPSIAVLADDLTSAADGAAPFVARGLTESIGRGQLPHQAEAAAIIAVDSGSRSATASQAFEAVARLTARLASRTVLYKTVDSTLRGHITAELEACFAASGRKALVFAPAFPQAGRTTVRGIQFVDGIPVSEGAYGHNPMHPARHSALVDLVPNCIKNVTLLDAVTQEQLDSQIASIEDPASILWVGSPGMAAALSRRFVPAKTLPPLLDGISSDVLVVIGSANLRSQRQAGQLQKVRGVMLLRGPRTREWDSAAVLRRIAQDAARELQSPRFGALIATGGDTMEAILDLLKVREFDILQELDPGFPLGLARLGDGRSLLLAMKAGGFGSDDAVTRAVARIRGATQ